MKIVLLCYGCEAPITQQYTITHPPAMIEKPHLQDKDIIDCLRDGYGLTAADIRFLPLGADSNAWVYQVTAQDGLAYFLKVRKGKVYEPALIIPRYLRDLGIKEVTAPLLNRHNQLWQTIDGYHLVLYPFITGQTGMETGMTDKQWVAFGNVLRQIHSAQLLAGLAGQVQKETFNPKWSPMVSKLDEQIDKGGYKTSYEAELSRVWKARREEIRQLRVRAEELGRLLRGRPTDFVLCHTDIHTANIILDQEQGLNIVDWDQPLLAPKERDLMFVVCAPGVRTQSESREERLFFKGYGETSIDYLAIAYYHYEWVVQEIGDYGERIFFRQDLGEETKQEAILEFQKLFHPGDVVEAAYKFDQSSF